MSEQQKTEKDTRKTEYEELMERAYQKRPGEQQKTEKDTRKIQILEKIKREREEEYEEFMEGAYPKGPEQCVAGLQRKNQNVMPRGLERGKNPVRGREEVPLNGKHPDENLQRRETRRGVRQKVENEPVEKMKRNKRKQETMRLERNDEFNKTRKLVGDRIRMCKLKRLGRKQCFESARKIINRVIQVLYAKRSYKLRVGRKKVREGEMEEDILMLRAIEEAVEREWRNGLLGGRECWDETMWTLMMRMVEGKQEKYQMHRQELRDTKDRYNREAKYLQIRQEFKKGLRHMMKESEDPLWDSSREWVEHNIEEVIEKQMKVVTALYIEQWVKLEMLNKQLRWKSRRTERKDERKIEILRILVIRARRRAIYMDQQTQGWAEIGFTKVDRKEISEAIRRSVQTEDTKNNWNERGQDQWSERKDYTNFWADQYRKQKQAESLGYDTKRDRLKWVLSPGNPDKRKGRREQRRRELLMLWEAPPMVRPKGIVYIFSLF